MVLFGYIKNQQNNGGIPSYPPSHLVVYCEKGDLVSEGMLLALPAHSTYRDEMADECLDKS